MPRSKDAAEAPAGIRAVVDEADVQESLDYLLDTADLAAEAFANADRSDERIKQAKAAGMLSSDEKSADRREADAISSHGYHRALDAREKAIAVSRRVFNMRRYHEIRIEVWRSLNANNRQIKL